MAPQQILVLHGGEVAQDVAEQLAQKKPDACPCTVTVQPGSARPGKKLLELDSNTVVCFVVQTIENEAPTEEAGSLIRFFKRKTHPTTLLEDKFQYAILGLGDSNLLLDRQTTTANDCNQVAQQLDARLEDLSGKRYYPVGLADERTGMEEVLEPWMDGFWKHVMA